MKYATLLAVALALQAAMGSVQAAAGAERIVAAREALRTGNRSQLDALPARDELGARRQRVGSRLGPAPLIVGETLRPC